MEAITGYTQKRHPFQIISYIFFSSLLLVYFLIIFPLSSDACRAVGATLIVIFMICVAISAHICTMTDTTDPLVHDAWRLKGQGKDYSHIKTENKCEFDRMYVHESSKHCKRCKRCTLGFDHHCKWVNNDIGKANYKPFIVMIVSVFFFLSTFQIFGALVTARYAFERNMVDYDIWLFSNNTSDIIAGMIFLWIFMILAILFMLLDLNLVLFHIFLIRKGLTTFQYITYVQERKEYRKEMEYARKVLGEKKATSLDFILCLNRKKKVASSALVTPTGKAEVSITQKDESPMVDKKLQKLGTGQGLLSYQEELDNIPEIVSEKNTAAEIYPKTKLVDKSEIASQSVGSSTQLKGHDGISQTKLLAKDSETRRKENLSIDIPRLPNGQHDNKRDTSPLLNEISSVKSDQNRGIIKNELEEAKLLSNRDKNSEERQAKTPTKARKNTDESNPHKQQLSRHNNYDKKIDFEKDEKEALKVKSADLFVNDDGIELKSPDLISPEATRHEDGDIEHGYASKFNNFVENQDEVAEDKPTV